MAIQLEKIKIGSGPNSQDGDKLRRAFIKVNSNFELLLGNDTYLEGLIEGLEARKVDKIEGKGLSTNDFTDNLRIKLENAESIAGAQEKADAAEANAITHSDEQDVLLQDQIDTKSEISETGYSLSANHETSMLYLKDKGGNTLSSISVGFLNNEGTKIEFNDDTREIELKNDSGEVISKFPVSDLLTKVGKHLDLDGTTLALLDSTNEVMSEVVLSIANITNLQTELDKKDTVTNVNTKITNLETSLKEWVQEFGIGGDLITKSGVSANSLDSSGSFYMDPTCTDLPTENEGYYLINLYLNPNHASQMVFNETTGVIYSRVKNTTWLGWVEQETTIGSQDKADVALSSAKSYADTKLADKVDKVSGKGLSTEDYTTQHKTIVEGIEGKLTQVETDVIAHANSGDANLQTQINNLNFDGDFVNATGDEDIYGVKTFNDDTKINGDLIISGNIYNTEGSNILNPYETLVGAQEKADTAKSEAVSEANTYTDNAVSLKQDTLNPDDGSIIIDSEDNIRVNVEGWDLTSLYEGELDF